MLERKEEMPEAKAEAGAPLTKQRQVLISEGRGGDTHSHMDTLSLKSLWDFHVDLEDIVLRKHVESEGKRARNGANTGGMGKGRGAP